MAEQLQGDSAHAPVVRTLTTSAEEQSDEAKKRFTDLRRSSTLINRLKPNDRAALEKRFFQVVSRGQVSNIEGYLESGLPVDTKDEHGFTALHTATQRRHVSIQQLLLKEYADPNAKDLHGRTALHVAADYGDVDSIKLFIAYGGKVNSKDKAGNSPLHCAVSASQKSTIDMLVFCGADGYQRNSGGMSPLELSASRDIARTVQMSKMISVGRKTGKIKIQSKNVPNGEELHLEEVDVRILILEDLQKPLGILCRRSEPEYSPLNLRDEGKELLLSDTFEYLLTDTATDTLKTRLEFPVYEKEETYEIIYLKTDKGDCFDVPSECIRKVAGKDRWLCDVQVDLKCMSGFVLVTYPKMEDFAVGSEPMNFTSSVDPALKLSVPANTFEEGKVLLQALPCVWYRPDEYEAIVSLSFFYDVSHSQKKQPKEIVTMTMPYPADYHVDSEAMWDSGDTRFDSQKIDASTESAPVCTDTDQLVIFTSDADCDTEIPEEKWQILPSTVDKSRGRISFDVSHFSIKVPVQVKRGASMKKVKREISQLHKRSVKREQNVVFLGLLKPLSETTFHLTVECTLPKKVRKRLSHWVTDMEFTDQKPSATGEFRTTPSTEYLISLSPNVKFSNDAQKSVAIMFQPKGLHYQTMKIELAKYRGFVKPVLTDTQNTMKEPTHHSNDISPTTSDSKSVLEDDKENAPDISIAGPNKDPIEAAYDDDMSGEVYFTEKEDVRSNIAQLVLFLKGLKKPPLTNAKTAYDNIEDFNGFTCNAFMRELSARMTSEWTRIGLRLGIPYSEVKQISASNEEPRIHFFKMLVHWREVTKQARDLGVPNLLRALKDSGRTDMAEYVMERLKEWRNSPNRMNSSATFDKWLRANFDHLESGADKDSPEPLSDLFFVVIAEMIGACLPIFYTLELTNAEIEQTRMDPRLADPQDQVIQLFQQWINKHGKSGHSFSSLLDAIADNSGMCVKEDIVNMTQQWFDQLAAPRDSYANEIHTVLQRYSL